MSTKIEAFTKSQLKQDLPDIKPGDIVRVYQKISISQDESTDKKGRREKAQVFEGQVLARKHGKEVGATIIVRKVFSGIGVEKTFPLHSPLIEKIEVVRRTKVRRAKLYYLRGAKGRKAKLKNREITSSLSEDQTEKITEGQS